MGVFPPLSSTPISEKRLRQLSFKSKYIFSFHDLWLTGHMTYQSENKAQWKGTFRKENQELAAQRISHKQRTKIFTQHTYKTIKTLVLRDWDRNRRTILWRKTTRQQLVPCCGLHLLGCRKRYRTTQTCVTQLIRWPESDNLLLFCFHSCAHECPLDEDWGSTMKQIQLHVQFGINYSNDRSRLGTQQSQLTHVQMPQISNEMNKCLQPEIKTAFGNG